MALVPSVVGGQNGLVAGSQGPAVLVTPGNPLLDEPPVLPLEPELAGGVVPGVLTTLSG